MTYINEKKADQYSALKDIEEQSLYSSILLKNLLAAFFASVLCPTSA